MITTSCLVFLAAACLSAELEYFPYMKDMASPVGATREIGACDIDEDVSARLPTHKIPVK